MALGAACGLGWAVLAAAAPTGPDPADDATQDEPPSITAPDKPDKLDLPSTGNKNLDLLLEMQPAPADKAATSGKSGKSGKSGSTARAARAAPSPPPRPAPVLDSSDLATGPPSARAHSALADGLLSEAAKLVEEQERERPEPGERRWVGPGDAANGRTGGAPGRDAGAEFGNSRRWLIPRSVILYLRENGGWIIGGALVLWALLGVASLWQRRRRRVRRVTAGDIRSAARKHHHRRHTRLRHKHHDS